MVYKKKEKNRMKKGQNIENPSNSKLEKSQWLKMFSSPILKRIVSIGERWIAIVL